MFKDFVISSEMTCSKETTLLTCGENFDGILYLEPDELDQEVTIKLKSIVDGVPETRYCYFL